MASFIISRFDKNLEHTLQSIIDNKTKPPGSLGKLESLGLVLGCIQNTTSPEIKNPVIVFFAADHGITQMPGWPEPEENTSQAVLRILSEKSPVRVFGRKYGTGIRIVDSGCRIPLDPGKEVVSREFQKGTMPIDEGPAMTPEECMYAVSLGAETVRDIRKTGCNVLGVSAMGEGSDMISALIFSLVSGKPLQKILGNQADPAIQKKAEILSRIQMKTPVEKKPYTLIATFGGFESAMTMGAILQAAESGMLVLVDNFAAGVMLLLAGRINPAVLNYAVFPHLCLAPGFSDLITFLNKTPLLSLGLSRSEGLGCASALPLLFSGAGFINEMASFASANVSNKTDS